MKQIIIGVDPHKLSATIEVVDQHERLLGSGRFATDKAGLRGHARIRRPVVATNLGRGRKQWRRPVTCSAAGR